MARFIARMRLVLGLSWLCLSCAFVPNSAIAKRRSAGPFPGNIAIVSGEAFPSQSFKRAIYFPTSKARADLVKQRLGLDVLSESIYGPLSSVFRWSGPVPVQQALIVNAILFTAARKKLLTSLTTAGYAHAFALGTALWTLSGWRGWSVCVLYLILGSVVTKVKFAYKEERGLAEGRGGRRGPENVW
jgi:hypothetical protein